MSTPQGSKGGQTPLQPAEIYSGGAFGPLQVFVGPGRCLQTSQSPGLNVKPLEDAGAFSYL